MNPRLHLLWLGVLLGAVVLRHPSGSTATIPPRLPAESCTLWMADCLPGVGAKRRPAAWTAVRSGAWEQLPKQAHPGDWFERP